MNRPLAALLVALMLTAATETHAVVLFDESTIYPVPPAPLIDNGVGAGTFNYHSVNDVYVTTPWHVTSITEYFRSDSWLDGGTLNGFVHVYSVAPTGNPMFDNQTLLFPGAFLMSGTVRAVTAVVDLTLTPGYYWIGFTPIVDASPHMYQMPSTSSVLDPVYTYGPGGWQHLYGGYDGAMTIEGDYPVPTDATTWGRIKALYR